MKLRILVCKFNSYNYFQSFVQFFINFFYFIRFHLFHLWHSLCVRSPSKNQPLGPEKLCTSIKGLLGFFIMILSEHLSFRKYNYY